MELKYRDSAGMRIRTGDIVVVGNGIEESMGEVIVSNDFGPGVKVEFVKSKYTGGEWTDIRGRGVTIIKPLMSYRSRIGDKLRGVTIQLGIPEPCAKAVTA